ncbi:MAG: glycoside hydrolase, partial [Thermoplasmata archaeon]|nr:glycoside hydrolase [Thermoplasmata archaeon]
PTVSVRSVTPDPTRIAPAHPLCLAVTCGTRGQRPMVLPSSALPHPGAHPSGSSATNWLVANWSGEGMIAENPTNPNNLVAGGLYQYLSSFNSTGYFNTGVSGAFTSWDGGRTWVDRTLPANPEWFNSSSATCNQLHLADTAIGFGPNNTVYYVDLTDSIGDQVCTATTTSLALYVTISTDGGNSWGTPIGLAGTTAGGFIDKPWIAIDPRTGEVYVAYNDDGNGTISLRNSTDNGLNWSRPVNLTSGTGGLGVELVVDPWGGVDATWANNGVEFCRSSDHGAHFSTPKLLATATSGATPSPDSFRAFMLPGLGIDDSAGTPYAGRLFSIWQNGSGGAIGTPVISLTYSSDNGTTWSNPTAINSNTTLESYQPDIAVGPDGTVYAEWYGERFSDGHYRLYGAESHDGGATFDPQFAVSDNDSVPTYAVGGSAGWWIGDYTHIVADQLGARPLWTDARSSLAWDCSPCLWGVNYNITFYTSELTNATLGSNVPVNITVNGTVPFPGNTSVGTGSVGVDALVGDTVNLTAPAQVLVNGTTWFFAAWYGSVDSENFTLATSVHGADRWLACFVPVQGWRCHAAGAPGNLVVNVLPRNATVKVDGVSTATPLGTVDLVRTPGPYQVKAWAVGHWPAMAVGNVTPGNVSYVNLTLPAVPGTLAGSVSPTGAAVLLNSTPIAVAANGSFTSSTLPGTYTLSATLYGYASYVNHSVSVQFNQTTYLPITLVPLPGWINGTVFPGNATVTINGADVSVVNGAYSVQELVGTYWVNATAPGFDPSTSGPLTMVPLGHLVSNLSLVLIVGTLGGTISPAWATVLVDQQPIVVTSGSFSLNLTPGVHTIAATAPQYDPRSASETIRANESTRIALALNISSGWIAGAVSPTNATVTVDGHPVVVTLSGWFNVTLKPGPHQLNASVPGFLEVDKTVTVTSDVTTHASITLTPIAAAGTFLTTTTVGLIVVALLIVAVLAVYIFWPRRRRPSKPSPP